MRLGVVQLRPTENLGYQERSAVPARAAGQRGGIIVRERESTLRVSGMPMGLSLSVAINGRGWPKLRNLLLDLSSGKRPVQRSSHTF